MLFLLSEQQPFHLISGMAKEQQQIPVALHDVACQLALRHGDKRVLLMAFEHLEISTDCILFSPLAAAAAKLLHEPKRVPPWVQRWVQKAIESVPGSEPNSVAAMLKPFPSGATLSISSFMNSLEALNSLEVFADMPNYTQAASCLC